MRNVWENKYVKKYDIHYSRIIASWVRSGGSLKSRDLNIFEDWLRSTGALTEEQIDDVKFLASNGKLEWETSAKNFLNEKKNF